MAVQTFIQQNKKILFGGILAGMIATLCLELCVLITMGTAFSVRWTAAFMTNNDLTRNKTEIETGRYSFGDDVIKPIKVTMVNCQALFDDDVSEAAKAKTLTDTDFRDYSASPYQHLTNRSSDCTQYIRDSGYITHTLTETEATFPIAFGIIMYKDAALVEKLLRAIYRPQNVYCMQVDSSSDKQVKKAIESVTKCFPNVFISNDTIDVQWGKVSIVKADIACMRTLLEKSKTWKYFINLTGQEFPLKTNSELVDILRALNGASDVQGKHERKMAYRYKKAGKPPYGLNPATGSTHVVLGRPFVEFIVYDQRARGYLNWTSKVHIPDETFVQTLYLSPSLEIPGAYKYYELKKPTDSEITRFKETAYVNACRGKVVNHVCILGVDYLSDMAKSRALFANKFHWDYEPAALWCMEELLYNRTRDEYLGKTTFNATAYSKLDFVQNQIHLES